MYKEYRAKMVKGKLWTYVHQFDGEPKDSDMELLEVDIPPVKDGEVLFEAEFLTVDPYMRVLPAEHGTKEAHIGEQVAKVIQSKNGKFKVGEYYLANFGWRTHTKVNPDKTHYTIKPTPPIGDLPKSLCLGTLGMPGATAYLALKQCCNPQKGETVLVTSGAGAVGHIVGQIAKILGCTVIGFAGSDKKVAWMKELGFDHAFNYKTVNAGEELKKVAPDGVHCFFDNVGGKFSDNIYANHLRAGSRAVVVGLISIYNSKEPRKVDDVIPKIHGQRMTVSGFLIYDQPYDKWLGAFKEMAQWMKEGKLKTKEHVTEGFANMRTAFYGLFKGDSFGKAIIKTETAENKDTHL